MLPGSLIRCSVRGDVVVPHFLGENDHPWLRALLDEHERFAGRPQRALDERLREPAADGTPHGKRALAIHVLRRVWGSQQRSAVPPREARAALFGEAARAPGARDAALTAAAMELGVEVAGLLASLFADLPGERVVTAPDHPISPVELALRTNLALAQALLFRASVVAIEVEGNARAIVRQAKLRRLMCSVTPRPPGDPRGGAWGSEPGGVATLEVSGPFALFRHTLVYGRALGELLPPLAWCRRFRLEASCMIEERRLTLRLGTGDPIFPSAEPRAYDSRAEERFARDFRRLAPAWDLVREPEPVPAAGTIVFPDFAVQHRQEPARRRLLEIVGFWTPEYLSKKLARYRAAGLSNLILCIDEERDCREAELPEGALVVRFRRRVDPAEVLRIVEGNAPIFDNYATAA